MFVKPAANPAKPGTTLIVRVPNTFAVLPDAGEEVPETAYWLERLRQGDVIAATEPTATPASAAPAATGMTVEQEAADLEKRIAAEKGT